jgi:hypothetical protein
MKRIIIYLFVLAACNIAQAQGDIQGIIQGWDLGKGRIMFYDIMTDTEAKLGDVSPSGEFQIPLEADYLSKTQKLAEKAQSKAPKGFSISFKDVQSNFPCSNQEMEVVNGSTILTGLPELIATTSKGKEIGVLYAVSSSEMAAYLYSYAMDPAVKGYHLYWVYVEEAASVKGTCTINQYTGNNDEQFSNVIEYDLQLKKGWNIIQDEYAELFTAIDGRTYSSLLTMRTLEQIPDDLQWILKRNNE